MTSHEPLIAGVELGGTKCIAVTARGRDIVSRTQWPTGDDPAITLGAIAAWLAAGQRAEPFAALGIASFGPLCLDPASPDHGRIVNTPKPGWSGADVLGIIAGDLAVPVALDTDVAGAALAEGRWGAAVGCPVHVYLTIGTGIGGGIVIDGRPFRGAFHPEMGHVPVRRIPGDTFGGICPIHGDCLEGLASGPAIAARTGQSAEALDPADPIWEQVANEIAGLAASLILTIAPHRVVLGGGVGQGQPALLPRVHRATARLLGGYLPGHSLAALQRLIVHPVLGSDAGVFGAVALAMTRLGDALAD
jgi:fructokinase